MDRNALRQVALAALCVVAVVFAAATLVDPVQPDGGGFGSGDGDRLGTSSDDRTGGSLISGNRSAATGSGPIFNFCYPVLGEPLTILAVLAVLLAAALIVRWRANTLVAGTFLLALVASPATIVYIGMMNCADGVSPIGGTNEDFGVIPESGEGSGGGMFGSAAGQTTPTPMLIVLALVLVVGIAALAFVLFADREPEASVEDEDEDGIATGGDRVAGVGQAAGEAADRLAADGDYENEIYRAWREMTAFLDVDRPRASTPGEFAAAAVDAGMDREDVDRLTALFEAVRYGNESPTETRERRAVAALRNIEAAYAEEGDDGTGGRDRRDGPAGEGGR